MKCFVAMAFGKEDANRFYDDLICDVLNECGITPVRVDRLEHNENIDDKMMDDLSEATFVIADLTYARPSVYFEAGFAEGCQIPVIYTVRRDHFVPHKDDEFGNFRVHFDLLMRNIIDWADPCDMVFRERLRSRVNHIVAPILAQKSTSDERERNRERFAALSYDDRRKLVLEAAMTERDSEEFGLQQVGAESSYSQDIRQRQSGETLDCLIVRLVDLRTRESQEKRNWELARTISPENFNLNLNRALARLKCFKEHYIALCLESLSVDEPEQALSEFRREPNGSLFVFEGTLQVPILRFETSDPVFHSVYGDTTFGFGVHKGACVKHPPSHLKSTKGLKYYDQGFRVIECGTRGVKLVRTYQIIHSIQSLEELIPRLQSAIRAVLVS